MVQDEASALLWEMPRSAVAAGCVDRVVPLADMAATLVNLVQAEPSWNMLSSQAVLSLVKDT